MSLINESMCGTVKVLCTVTGRRIYLFLDGAFAQWSYKGIKYSVWPYSCIDLKEHYLCQISDIRSDQMVYSCDWNILLISAIVIAYLKQIIFLLSNKMLIVIDVHKAINMLEVRYKVFLLHFYLDIKFFI